MYELWNDYIKPEYEGRAKLCYIDTDSFVINIETEDFYKYIANDVERWFDTDLIYGLIIDLTMMRMIKDHSQ